MVIVSDARFVSRRRTSGLDPPNQARRCQSIENVVHRLPGYFRQHGTHEPENGVGICVRVVFDDLEYRDPGTGHAHIDCAQ